MEAWMGSGKSANIRCLDLDRWQACDVFLVSLLNAFFEVFQRILGLFLKLFNPRSDNVTEGSIRKFIETHQQQLEGLVLTGMGHVTDMLFITCLPKTKVSLQRWTRSWEKSTDLLIQNLRVLAMGTAERISLKIQFEHLIAAIAQNCPHLERLEFRWATRQRESMSHFLTFCYFSDGIGRSWDSLRRTRKRSTSWGWAVSNLNPLSSVTGTWAPII